MMFIISFYSSDTITFVCPQIVEVPWALRMIISVGICCNFMPIQTCNSMHTVYVNSYKINLKQNLKVLSKIQAHFKCRVVSKSLSIHILVAIPT